ncbi:MAG: ATP-dependent Clp protease ATP-binding subunit [Rhodospirillales bacterium]|nr:ATP-dependent Clp protease ATP-binding subunit [Rhodospirillales bacterium]
MAIKRFLVSDDELEEMIHRYCRDLTTLAREGRYDPITGRDKEIQEMVLTLLQKGRKNVVLQAPAGVGKTAAVVGLAQAVVAEKVPEYLYNARILEIDLASMAAGTESIAEFQGRFVPLCRGVAERYHVEGHYRFILFIDEMHQIMPLCENSSYRGLSEVMKPYLTAGDLLVIGATTLDEYRVYVAEDPAMDRRFQKIHLKVPNSHETFEILKALRPAYEEHHRTKIPDDVLQMIVDMTDKYLRRRNQPDKSIIVMDAACAYHVMEYGWHGELDKKSVQTIVSIESKLSPDALEGKDKNHH